MKKYILLTGIILATISANCQVLYGELEKIVASDRAANDKFAYIVSIDGDYAVVGAYTEDEDAAGANNMTGAGSAYVFEKDGLGNWNEVQKIVASDRASNDNFGWSVSISGDYIIVGAYREDEDLAGANTLSSAGSAYIFERDGGGVWNEVQKIVASDRDAGDSFGYSVSISGDYLVVGAFGESEDESGGNTMAQSGSGYVFELSGGVWSEVQKIVASDRASGDLVGTSVAISGDYLVMTARGEDEDEAGANTLSDAGSAYVFERSGGVWSEVQKIVASDRAASDIFGGYVAISGDYIMVGAFQEDEDEAGANTLSSAGSVYVFERNAGVWSETQKLVASDRAAADNYGWSISMSGDLAVIGAYREDEDANGTATMSSAGSAYIVERDGGGTWNEIQKIVPLDRGPNDNFAGSVSISGTEMLIGAYKEDEDESGTNTLSGAGSAYIFDFCQTTSAFNAIACDAYTVPSGDETYTIPGVYMDTIPNINGCDSVMTITVSFNNSSSTIDVLECATYTVPSGDETYTSTGMYMDTIPNYLACDSVITINLVIGGSTNSFSISACDSYTVPSGDETYTSTGIYLDTIPNYLGCDSVMTIDVSINTASASAFSVIECLSYTVPSGDETYTVSGIYNDTIPNVLGCDSVMTIDLAINGSTNSISVDDCYSYTVPSGDETYTSTGIYMDTIPNFLGCDSIITIDLTINSSTSNLSISECNSYTVPSGDETYTSTGIYNDTIPNYLGCDSLIIIDLAISGPTTSSITETACGSYTVPSGDETHTTTGVYMDTIPNFSGCDSIITIDLTIGGITAVADYGVNYATGGNDYLVASPSGYTYQWIYYNDADCSGTPTDVVGATSDSIDVTGENWGYYAVIITDGSCVDTSDCIWHGYFGLDELEESINIYPNPTQSDITITMNGTFQFDVVNIVGETILTAQGVNSAIVDLSDYENGIYLIRIRKGDKAYFHKVIKQ